MSAPPPKSPFSLHFPLSAVAHQPQLVLALSLLAVSPDIGGLLIRGDRGAAKSTAARALGALLPGGGPFVNLPLGATEDRIVGTLDLEAALQGSVRLLPGLLSQADGGVLYIDEVNLLPDHLVDLLLDAAAMGVVRVQRDSLSAEQRARFALVGSMNPEEGSLRPQFLDRFGLCVDIAAPQLPHQRAEIVRRRMAFEADPAQFVRHWQTQEAALAERLALARERLSTVHFPDELLEYLAECSTQAGVRSLRADLVLYRAARALAALEGHSAVSATEIAQVAPLVLLHRREPLRESHLPAPPAPPSDAPKPPTSGPTAPPAGQPEADPNPSNPNPSNPNPPGPNPSGTAPGTAPNMQQSEVYAPAEQPSALRLVGRLRAAPPSQAAAQRPGRLIRAVRDPQATRLHLPASLRSAAQREVRQRGARLARQDFQRGVYAQQRQRVLFVADTSGSVGLAGRMGAVKRAMLDALGTRREVALLVFRGPGAELLLDWTSQREAAEQAIRSAATGGRTPLAHALQQAAQMLQRGDELVLLTDGRANVPLSPGSDAWADALAAAQTLRAKLGQGRVTVVDTEAGTLRLGRAAQLAQLLGGTVQPLG